MPAESITFKPLQEVVRHTARLLRKTVTYTAAPTAMNPRPISASVRSDGLANMLNSTAAMTSTYSSGTTG